MTTRAFAAAPVLETDGSLNDWVGLLVETRVDCSAGLPALADLRFRDPQHRLLAKAGIGIGSPLRVSAATTADRSRIRIFSGEVTRVSCEVDESGTFTVIRAHDLAHRLTRGRRLAVWKRATLREVVEKIAGHAGLKVGRVADATYRHLVQPNITDWAFLSSLAELHGAAVAVSEDVLSMPPASVSQGSSQPYKLIYGDNLLSLASSVEALGPVRSLQVRGWNSDTKEPITARAAVADSPRLAIGAGVSQLARAWRGDTVTEVVGTGFALREYIPAAASALADTASADFARLEAVAAGSPHLTAGTAVALVGVGSPFTGRYTVTGAHHVFDGDGYRTLISVASPEHTPTAAAEPPSYAVPGLAIGIVADVKEPDGRQSGAVKLTFPWLDDAYTSDWARTVQWGGVGGGGVISPGAGDEVLVGFEQGRLDRPYVLGGLYNGKDKPSEHSVELTSESGKVNRRSLASRAGDRVELLDAAGAQGVLVATGGGSVSIRLDRATGTLSLTADKIVITGKTSVAINSPQVDVKQSGGTP